MRISIEHRLRVALPPQTGNAVLQLLLTPLSGAGQHVEMWDVEAPGIAAGARFADAFGNARHLINQLRPEGAIEITARGVVKTQDTNGVLGKPAGEPVPALFLRPTAATRAPVTLYGKFRSTRADTIATLHGLMARVAELMGEAQAQSQSQGAEGQSQQQEMRGAADASQRTHAFIGAARALDIPARFVTGYALDAPDATQLHCWAEAYDAGLGWIGFDPTLALCPTTRHVRLAAGLDAGTVPPLRCVPAGDGVETVSLSVSEA
jgi:transglutaminase-like putative cysteine protease